ncbi:hypothetical protein EVA_09999 [gut metagenome]|uniref:Uncharacterized protein n=1 Tax=gut metagenome TaxID=749906 RepID=J9G4U9_9ZZZZ
MIFYLMGISYLYEFGHRSARMLFIFLQRYKISFKNGG